MAPRHSITLEDKLKIIKDIDSGTKQKDVAKKYCIPPSTISTLVKNRKSIELMVESGKINISRRRVKDAVNKSIDSATIKWFNEMRARNVPLNGPLICEKAKKFASMLGVENFKASSGWLRSFKKRYGITFKFVKLSGEDKPVPIVNEEVRKQFELMTIEAMYHPNDIYNAVETGLFYQSLPEKTFAYKDEKGKGGNKVKERLTLLLCVNATGTDKVKPLVIGKSAKPCCFQHIKSSPVEYLSNKSAWMTEDIFNEWLRNLDSSMATRNKQIALIVDNCTPHKNPPPMENVHIYYFNPNFTSVLQPLDLGIIKCTKGYYRINQIEKIIFKLENHVSGPFNINVKQACDMIGSSWNVVKQNTIQNCWRRAGFSFISNNVMEFNNGFPFQLGHDDPEESNCIESLENSLSAYHSATGKHISTNAEDYVKVDQELLVFGGSIEEDIIAEVIASTPGDTEDDEETDTTDVKNLTSVEAVLLIERLYSFMSTLSNVPDQYFFVLDSLTNMCMNASKKRSRSPL